MVRGEGAHDGGREGVFAAERHQDLLGDGQGADGSGDIGHRSGGRLKDRVQDRQGMDAVVQSCLAADG